MNDEDKAVVKILEVYADTNRSVSQSFYRGLCAFALSVILRLDKENKKLKRKENEK